MSQLLQVQTGWCGHEARTQRGAEAVRRRGEAGQIHKVGGETKGFFLKKIWYHGLELKIPGYPTS